MRSEGERQTERKKERKRDRRQGRRRDRQKQKKRWKQGREPEEKGSIQRKRIETRDVPESKYVIWEGKHNAI